MTTRTIKLNKTLRQQLMNHIVPMLEPVELRDSAEAATQKYIDACITSARTAVKDEDVRTLSYYGLTSMIDRVDFQLNGEAIVRNEHGNEERVGVMLCHSSGRDEHRRGLSSLDHLAALAKEAPATSRGRVMWMASNHIRHHFARVNVSEPFPWLADSMRALRIPAPSIRARPADDRTGDGKLNTCLEYNVNGGWYPLLPQHGDKKRRPVQHEGTLNLFKDAAGKSALYTMTWLELIDGARTLINRITSFDKLVDQWPEIEQFRSVVATPNVPAIMANVDPNLLSRLRTATRTS